MEGFGPLELATTDPAPVVGWADVIMVVVPAFVHRLMAEICAPHLRDGQIVLLNPGRTGGALEFANVLRERGVRVRVRVAEAQTLIYACRISGPARVRIMGIKRRVPVAALPASDTPHVLEVVQQLYPEFTPAANVLETSFDNIGAVFHPATMILNANRIEAGEDFDFYRGMTPMVAGFLEVLDRERMAVAAAYGVTVESAADWLLHTYEGIAGDSLYERIQSNRAYAGIKAPKTLNTRYITEDVPCSLVPIVSFAEAAGVPTPASQGIVNISCGLLGQDFWAEGRTVEKLGLAGMGVREIVAYVNGKGAGD
ncbi:MAG TPA: NADP transhydrogenase subunit alpha [Anaerolineae bacterium]|nr:NADP transhydrogenase subunit alpha [Anaerolineae bacterium]